MSDLLPPAPKITSDEDAWAVAQGALLALLKLAAVDLSPYPGKQATAYQIASSLTALYQHLGVPTPQGSPSEMVDLVFRPGDAA
jgi:hypothetical protein